MEHVKSYFAGHVSFMAGAAMTAVAMVIVSSIFSSSAAFAQNSNSDAAGTLPTEGVSPSDMSQSAPNSVPTDALGTPVDDSQYQAPSVPDTSSGGYLQTRRPIIADPNRRGFFEAGIGPSFALGMSTDQALFDLVGAYLYNINPQVAGKVLADLNFGAGTDTSRWINLALGADYYLSAIRPSYGIPYITGDIGFGFTRTASNREDDAPAVGGGAGFKFATQALNLDINLHYQVLTAQVDNRTPSLLGLRAAMNF